MNRNIFIASFYTVVFAVSVYSVLPAAAQIPLENINGGTPSSDRKFSRSLSMSLSDAQDSAENISEATRSKENEILHPWKDKLPFELNLDKVKAFIIAGKAVEKNNRNWDALMAAADTTEKAKEFFTQETEEATDIINEIPNIKLEEYKILYQLSLQDADFAVLLKALKQHIYPDEEYKTE